MSSFQYNPLREQISSESNIYDTCDDSAAGPSYVSNADLATVYGEMAAQSGVEVCGRPADIPGLKQLGVPHKWIRTPNEEVGLGADDGAVPGHNSSPDLPWVRTKQVDHTGEGDLPESTCKPVPDIDQDCVERELEAGQPTGKRWIEQNCWDFVDDVIRKCTVPKEAPIEEGGSAD